MSRDVSEDPDPGHQQHAAGEPQPGYLLPPADQPEGSQPYGSQPYGSQPYGSQGYAPQPQAPEPHGAQGHGAQPYAPPLPDGSQPYGQPYAPQGFPPYPPQPYGSQPYPPQPYGPGPARQPMPGQQPWGQAALPVPARPVARPGPMPDGPREYQQMLRGPRNRWWRVLLTALLAAAIYLPLAFLAFVPVIVAGAVAGISAPQRWAVRQVLNTDDLGPGGFLYVNLSLVILIPTAGLSIWIAHRIRPRFLASVQGGFRWRWLLRCLVVVVPVWAVFLGLSAVLDPATSPRPAHWVLLLVIVLCLTPFQAAGEEYFFRGWILQNVGSWFRHPIVGLVAGLAVSTAAFSAAHGSPNVWVLADLGVFALTAGIATWRTGGLEAGIAIHAVNNIGVFFTVILMGGWQDAFVGSTTTSTFSSVAVSLLVHAVVLSLILWQARRAGLQCRYLPAQPAEITAGQAQTVVPG